jgi:hypothetical protein
VGINRQLGSAARGALFHIEVAVSGVFHCDVTFGNVELWQIGLLALCVRDLAEGYLQLGYGKSRGLGVVSVQNIELGWLEVAKNAGDRLRGLGSLTPNPIDYQLQTDDHVPTPIGFPADTDGLRVRRCFSGESYQTIVTSIVEGPWQKMIAAGQ